MHTSDLPPIILGSSSIFRKQLLEKLHLPFTQLSPEIDESPLANEPIAEMIKRLSIAKAEAIAEQHPSSLIIASDQCALFNGQPIGKPHTHEKAVQQLSQFSGKAIQFLTGLTIVHPQHSKPLYSLDTTTVHFRQLTAQQIENYLLTEEPYQCAGSFKSEGLGITLFERIESKDPNALIGLPLIELTGLLKQVGIELPLQPNQPNH